MSNERLYMAELPPALHRMVKSAEEAHRNAERQQPLEELKRQIADAPPVRSLANALSREFGMIAEIKECSPSMGAMLASNVSKAADLYAKSPVVKAISVLTNAKYFGVGMTMERLRQIKGTTGKPTLRKEFIVAPYQIYEARAYGADAVLLMANVLTKEGLRQLFSLCVELGMEALFEIHTKAEIEKIPANAKIYGINSRSFKSSEERFAESRTRSEVTGGRSSDLTTDLANFQLCKELPAQSIKVAESGIDPSRCAEIRQLGFNAILVGTSLLIGPEPIEKVLGEFEKAIGRIGPIGPIR